MNLKLARRRNIAAFTLIEMIVVIAILIILVALLIVTIFVFLEESKEDATTTRMQDIAASISELETKSQIIQLIRPVDGTKIAKGDFISAVGGTSQTIGKLKPMQRSKLLAYLIAPSQEQWNKIVDPDKNGGSMPAYQPLMAEGTARGMLIEDEGFNYFADGWDQPITIEFASGSSVAMGATSTSLPWVLVSGGPDFDLSTHADNIWYSSSGTSGTGEWKKAFDN